MQTLLLDAGRRLLGDETEVIQSERTGSNEKFILVDGRRRRVIEGLLLGAGSDADDGASGTRESDLRVWRARWDTSGRITGVMKSQPHRDRFRIV